MPIVALSYRGKSWPKDKFVAACISGECKFPAPVAATIIKNMGDYNNHHTVSGSQLHAECDYRRVLKQLPYTENIENLFYATFRGSNVHAMIESCKKSPEFGDWVFERRFFATLTPDNRIKVLHVPTLPNLPHVEKDMPDWESFNAICAHLREQGHIILSGALDAYEKRRGHIKDWKTAKMVGRWTNVKESWQEQMNMYTLLARVNGCHVTEVEITVFDASTLVVLKVPLVNEEAWIPNYFIPRVRYLAGLQRFTPDDIRAINDGEQEPPEDFPQPVVCYLCDGENKEKKIYCPFRENGMCPAWRAVEAISAANQPAPQVKA